MPDLRAVFFDLDGVLIDSKEAWFRLVNGAARHFCKPDVSRDRFDAGWGQGIDADLRQFFPGCDAGEVERFYVTHLLDFDTFLHVQPGARDTLYRLRDAELLRGVVTNTPTPLARDLLAWAGLIGLVDLTAGPAPARASKPAPDIILFACRELAVEPRRVLVVGDSHFDAEAAKAARTQFLGFRTPEEPALQALDELPARIGVRPRR